MKKLFDEIPYMDHDRLVLKKLEKTDSEALLELIRSEPVYRYLPSFLFERQFGDDMHEMIRELYFECFEQKESLILGVYLKDGMRFCGLAEYYGYKDAIHKTCLGYRLMESCWGTGDRFGNSGYDDQLLFLTDGYRDHHCQHNDRKPCFRQSAGKERVYHDSACRT